MSWVLGRESVVGTNIDVVDVDSDQEDGNQEAGRGGKNVGGLQRGSVKKFHPFDPSH